MHEVKRLNKSKGQISSMNQTFQGQSVQLDIFGKAVNLKTERMIDHLY